ncbi:hypothetical protein [Tomitella biformata]|uniref:hypothetical protein n=1 Tax=Tomitella biformata TaxID=630403 RepID=UPI00046761E7|nr:hypothetical protein [Tomitella biformata]
MGWHITPTLTIGGVPVECDPSLLDLAPLALDDIVTTWGRTDYLADAEPASARLAVIDATGHWGRRVRDGTALGLAVIFGWSGTPTGPTTGDPITGTLFRGRTAHVDARRTANTTATGARVWQVEITAADMTADLGNMITFPETWPSESMLARAIRIKSLAAQSQSGIGDFYFWPGYVEATTWPLDVANKTALDLCADFYRSMGADTYSYDPETQDIRQSIRLSQPMAMRLATFDTGTGAVMLMSSDVTVDGIVYPGIGLSGCELAAELALTASRDTDINTLECQWKDFSTGYGDWTTVRSEVVPGDSRRALAWTSWLDNGTTIDPTLDNVWDKVRSEARTPRHPVVTAKPGHEFITEGLARWLLQGCENTRSAYLNGDELHRWLYEGISGTPPLYSPLGGVVTYTAKRGWAIALDVQMMDTTTPVGAAAAMTWAGIRQYRWTTTTPSVPWWWFPKPAPVPVMSPTPERDLTWGAPAEGAGYRFDRSTTWGDLRHLAADTPEIHEELD